MHCLVHDIQIGLKRRATRESIRGNCNSFEALTHHPRGWRACRRELERMPASLRPIRLLLVNRHPVVRDGLRMMLNNRPGLTIVGEATAPAEAVRTAGCEQ